MPGSRCPRSLPWRGLVSMAARPVRPRPCRPGVWVWLVPLNALLRGYWCGSTPNVHQSDPASPRGLGRARRGLVEVRAVPLARAARQCSPVPGLPRRGC